MASSVRVPQGPREGKVGYGAFCFTIGWIDFERVLESSKSLGKALLGEQDVAQVQERFVNDAFFAGGRFAMKGFCFTNPAGPRE